jgi:hypothetical protein
MLSNAEVVVSKMEQQMKERPDPLKFYEKVISQEWIEQLCNSSSAVSRVGIFNSSLTVWLMLCQRLRPGSSLQQALEFLRIEASSNLLGRSTGSIRARCGRVSDSASGFCRARKRIPESVVEAIADQLNEEMFRQSAESRERAVFVIDGSTIQIPHSAENVESYPLHKNQHGETHFPLIRVGVATEAHSGLAIRPACGPYNGEYAVSEHDLADELLPRIPNGSIVIGDRYYGCFRFIYQSRLNSHDVICRVKIGNVKRILGNFEGEVGEKAVTWTPSKVEQQKYPHLNAETAVNGRFIWLPIQQAENKKETLLLFTTLELPAKQVAELYALRWNVETDLRHIKHALEADFITAKSPAVVRKELVLAVSAYNLIRHLILGIATAHKLQPRQFSFASVLSRVNAIAAMNSRTAISSREEKAFTQAFTEIKYLLLPKRKKRPPRPRKVWPKGKVSYFSTAKTDLSKVSQKLSS